MTPKYRPLTAWLRGIDEDEVTVALAELDELVDRLPQSARTYSSSWWGNTAGRPHGDAWLSAGWRVKSVNVTSDSVTFARGVAIRPPAIGRPPVMNGRQALEHLLEQAGYPTIETAVAAHTVFLHPDTVAQAAGKAIVPVVRGREPRRRQFGTLDGDRPVGFDDNTTPKVAFLWAADRVRGDDTQFNHVWMCTRNPDAYTALWNLCCTPAFLGKTTDNHPMVLALLQYRAWDLFAHRPSGMPIPPKPRTYEALTWAGSPPAVPNLEQLMRHRMRSAPETFATRVARKLGWAFSSGPDAAL